ncbi:MAG: DUF2975 domain-containing protein [Verrucomicrobiae bacterium]|nr:DUF2975 domain-containing protein [Verrucomicrobiae bacterium]
MKHRTSKITKLFHLFTFLGMFLTGLMALLIPLIFGLSLFGLLDMREYDIQLPVSIDGSAFPSNDPSKPFQSISILEAKAELSSANFAPATLVLSGFAVFVVLLLIFCALRELNKLLCSIKASEIFIQENYQHLKRFAWLNLALVLIWPALELALSVHVSSLASFDYIEFVTGYHPDWNRFFLVLALFIIADVFKHGIELKNEQDLTI